MYSMTAEWAVEARRYDRESQASDALGPPDAPRDAPPPETGQFVSVAPRRALAIVLAVALALALGGLLLNGPDAAVDGDVLGVTAVPAAAEPAASEAPAQPAIVLLSPREGELVGSSAVDVDAVAARPLGTVRFAIVRNADVLGTVRVSVDRAGPFRVTIPLDASRQAGAARLTISREGATGVPLVNRTLRVCPRCA